MPAWLLARLSGDLPGGLRTELVVPGATDRLEPVRLTTDAVQLTDRLFEAGDNGRHVLGADAEHATAAGGRCALRRQLRLNGIHPVTTRPSSVVNPGQATVAQTRRLVVRFHEIVAQAGPASTLDPSDPA